jgi:hypothetical protein
MLMFIAQKRTRQQISKYGTASVTEMHEIQRRSGTSSPHAQEKSGTSCDKTQMASVHFSSLLTHIRETSTYTLKKEYRAEKYRGTNIWRTADNCAKVKWYTSLAEGEGNLSMRTYSRYHESQGNQQIRMVFHDFLECTTEYVAKETSSTTERQNGTDAIKRHMDVVGENTQSWPNNFSG